MPNNPAEEWRRLNEYYSGIADEQLFELAADYRDLTGTAQQVLHDEMKKRGLGDPALPETWPRVSDELEENEPDIPAKPSFAFSPGEMDRFVRHYAGLSDDDLVELACDAASLTPAAQHALRNEMNRRNLELDIADTLESEPTNEGDPEALQRAEREMAFRRSRELAQSENPGPHDYTWKVELCECEGWDSVWQVQQVLKRAGIESWNAGSRSGDFLGMAGPKVYVAADQLEQAKQVIAQPIPQEIIDESRMEIPEYEAPVCPGCGAVDPVLESADPVNRWHCEACNKEWADPREETASTG